MSADEAREQRGEILREIHHGLSFYADGMAYFAGAGWRAIWKDGGAEARKALDALDRLKRQEEKPRCTTCDDTKWICAECRKPRPRCSCGLDGISQDGCPDCSPAEKPDEDWPKETRICPRCGDLSDTGACTGHLTHPLTPTEPIRVVPAPTTGGTE